MDEIVKIVARELASVHYAARFNLPQDHPHVVMNADTHWRIRYHDALTALTALHNQGYAVVKVNDTYEQLAAAEMETWERVLSHPQAGTSDLRYLHSLAVIRRLFSPTEGAPVDPAKVRHINTPTDTAKEGA